jgi:aquaporin Z
MLRELHWPEYLIEAAGLGVFMVSACAFGTLLEDPGSVLRQWWPALLTDPFLRRCLMGLAMGATAVAILYSPWGKRSGAHINPAVTLCFWRLGRIGSTDAVAYVVFQFLGGTVGVLLSATVVGAGLSHPAVNYVVTVPGREGVVVALLSEVAICFVMMSSVLTLSSYSRLQHFTGLACATLLALDIAFESPLSGTSLNPARTFASAAVAGVWTDAWIYFVAPPLGMLAAAEMHARLAGTRDFHSNHCPMPPCANLPMRVAMAKLPGK